MKSVKYIVGIDEAGRGPLAGPVSVGVVITPADFNKKILAGVRDSKKLSEFQREIWFKKLKKLKKEKKLDFSVALISSQIIDEKGISYAIKLGIIKCLRKVKADPKLCSVLLDGGLKAPVEFLNQKTIIKGDDKILLISLASIAAKVMRDRRMKVLAKQYPKYCFNIHKGYGTLSHRKTIEEFGLSVIHRKSFCKNITKNMAT